MIITSKDSNDPENFRPKPKPSEPTPLMQMQQKAERRVRAADAAQARKEFIEMLKDLQQINALLKDPVPGKAAGSTPIKPTLRNPQ